MYTRWPPVRDVSHGKQLGADHAIYVLVDPNTRLPKYVGKSKNPRSRYLEHLRLNGGRRYPVNRWAKSLAKQGNPPEMVILEWTADWETSERKWVAGIKAEGYELLNMSGGGLEMKHVTVSNKKYRFYVWALRWCGRKKQKELADLLRTRAREARAMWGEDGMDSFNEWLRIGLYKDCPIVALKIDGQHGW